jgi:FixJ family two-component response regulator
MRFRRSSVIIGVVDDDESVRLATGSLLRSANWQAMGYASADELLSDPKRGKLSVVVADIEMPGMSGFGLVEAINQWKRPVPVILITAYATHDLVERARACGAAGFFSKPLDDAGLLARIEELARK